MNIVKLNIANRHELLRCYIKQFKGGGVFAKGKYNYKIGDKIFVLISLQETNESIAVNTTVGWIASSSVIGYPEGIGCQFTSDKACLSAKNKIETMLGTALNKDYESYTF